MSAATLEAFEMMAETEGLDLNGACASFGMKWEALGESPPSIGQEIANPDLASALARTKSFTAKDLESFGLEDLQPTDFIRSGELYFRPAGGEFEILAEMLDEVPSSPDGFDGAQTSDSALQDHDSVEGGEYEYYSD